MKMKAKLIKDSDGYWLDISNDVITKRPLKKSLKDNIKSHDRIVMLGHGTESGLLGHGRYIIDPTMVYLLREKICVSIWCNADVIDRVNDTATPITKGDFAQLASQINMIGEEFVKRKLREMASELTII